MIKYCARIFVSLLTKLFNHCISQAVVTNDWKFAIISPLFKGKGARDELDNYRGISILQVIAKLFERILCTQITAHFDRNRLFIRNMVLEEIILVRLSFIQFLITGSLLFQRKKLIKLYSLTLRKLLISSTLVFCF